MAAFTTIAAGVGMAATAATTTASFAQAGKQRRLQRKAESEAERAMAEAKKDLEVNYYEQLGINKEVYETEREAQLVAAAQAIEAARESDRGAEATAGRVMLAEQEAQKDITKRMNEEIQAINAAIAGEQSRLRDVGVQLNLEEVAGAQLAAAQADEMAGRATQQALQGVVSLGQQVAQAAPLYAKSSITEGMPDIRDTATPTLRLQPKDVVKMGQTYVSPKMISPTPTAIAMPMQGISPLAPTSMQGIGLFNPAQPLYDWSKILGYR